MTEHIPKICAAFEMWQNNDSIEASTTLELIMRYLADDPEIDVVVSSNDQDRAYLDYIIRQNEIINAKTLIIRELNSQITKLKTDNPVTEELQNDIDDTIGQLVNYRGRCDYLSDQIAGLIDSNTRIKADLASVKSDRDIMFDNYRNTKHKLQTDIQGLEAELSARKEDSAVLMKVVEIVRPWDNEDAGIYPNLYQLNNLHECLADYLNAPEEPPETSIDDLYTTTISVMLEMP